MTYKLYEHKSENWIESLEEVNCKAFDYLSSWEREKACKIWKFKTLKDPRDGRTVYKSTELVAINYPSFRDTVIFDPKNDKDYWINNEDRRVTITEKSSGGYYREIDTVLGSCLFFKGNIEDLIKEFRQNEYKFESWQQRVKD